MRRASGYIGARRRGRGSGGAGQAQGGVPPRPSRRSARYLVCRPGVPVERYGITTSFSSELVEVNPERRTATFETAGPEGKFKGSCEPRLRPAVGRPTPAGPGLRAGELPWGRAPTAGCPWSTRACATSPTRKSPPSATSATLPPPRPARRSAARPRSSPRTRSPRCRGVSPWPATTATTRARSPAPGAGRSSPSSTTALPDAGVHRDTQRERYDMWRLKRYGLTARYWQVVLRCLGRARRCSLACTSSVPARRPRKARSAARPRSSSSDRRPRRHRDAMEAEGALAVSLGPFRVDGLG